MKYLAVFLVSLLVLLPLEVDAQQRDYLFLPGNSSPVDLDSPEIDGASDSESLEAWSPRVGPRASCPTGEYWSVSQQTCKVPLNCSRPTRAFDEVSESCYCVDPSLEFRTPNRLLSPAMDGTTLDPYESDDEWREAHCFTCSPGTYWIIKQMRIIQSEARASRHGDPEGAGRPYFTAVTLNTCVDITLAQKICDKAYENTDYANRLFIPDRDSEGNVTDEGRCEYQR